MAKGNPQAPHLGRKNLSQIKKITKNNNKGPTSSRIFSKNDFVV
jgi:hypothetical protein